MKDREKFRAVAVMLSFSALVAFAEGDRFGIRLAQEALEQTRGAVTYDSAYARLAYPGGDVPQTRGVCADVVVRAYRKLGVDFQALVHEDMKQHFKLYPPLWGLTRPDANIDHRRVPNLIAFLNRFGTVLTTAEDPSAYQPGDLVTWMVNGNLPHIGIVAEAKSATGKGHQIIHNIGQGPRLEDRLFEWPVTGHFRYAPKAAEALLRERTQSPDGGS